MRIQQEAGIPAVTLRVWGPWSLSPLSQYLGFKKMCPLLQRYHLPTSWILDRGTKSALKCPTEAVVTRGVWWDGALIIRICVIRVHHHCGSLYRSLQHILHGTSPVTNESWDSWRSGGWQWWVTMPFRVSVWGDFWALSGHDRSVSESNRLHVVIFRVFFVNVRYIPWIPLKWSVIFLNSCTSTGYSTRSTRSSATIDSPRSLCSVRVTPGSWSSSPLPFYYLETGWMCYFHQWYHLPFSFAVAWSSSPLGPESNETGSCATFIFSSTVYFPSGS